MSHLESWRAGLPELSRPLVMGVVNVTRFRRGFAKYRLRVKAPEAL